MSGSRFVYVTYIRTTPERLWDALTTPETIKQYRFGMSVEMNGRSAPRGECMLTEASWTRARFSKAFRTSGW